MKKLFLLILFSWSLMASAQWFNITGTAQKNTSTGNFQWNFGANGIFAPYDIFLSKTAAYTKAHIDSLINAASTKTYILTLTPGATTVTDSRLINANVTQAFRTGLIYLSTGGSPGDNTYAFNSTTGTLSFANYFDPKDFVIANVNTSVSINGVATSILNYNTLADISYPITANSLLIIQSDNTKDNSKTIYIADAGTSTASQLQFIFSYLNNFIY